MRFHSIEYKERNDEFIRIFCVATSLPDDLLIVPPNGLSSIQEHLENTIGKENAKKLIKTRQLNLPFPPGLPKTLYLEWSNSKPSGFKGGSVLLPWVQIATCKSYIECHKTKNSFYIPWTGPGSSKLSGVETVDELSEYRRLYPDSVAI